MKRKALARWSGSLKAGAGSLSTPSGVLNNAPYSFASRFEKAGGTNPEEMIAAAHAGCFAMALSAALSTAGHTPKRIDATAVVAIEKVGDGWSVTSSDLDVDADVPGIDESRFRELAEEAKAGCPISRLLNARISLKAHLSQEIRVSPMGPG